MTSALLRQLQLSVAFEHAKRGLPKSQHRQLESRVMTILDRMTQLRALVVATETGTDPVVKPIPNDDNWEYSTEVYGDNVIPLFKEVFDPCHHPRNPSGQHIYGGRNDRACLYCGSKSGLDR